MRIRQKLTSGEGEVSVGGGIQDENANVDERLRDAKECSVTAVNAGGSRLRELVLRSLVPLFMLTFTPNIVIILWYTAVHCDGSYQQLFQVSLHRAVEKQWRFYVGARGHRPPNLAQAPLNFFQGYLGLTFPHV